MQILENYDLTKLNTFGIKAEAKYFTEINKEEDKYKLVNHWFTGTEKVLPWFELNVWLKDFSRNMDLWIN